jgi:hypothetical protein
VTGDTSRLKHDDVGSLSFYFRQVARSGGHTVVTPAVLADAKKKDKAVLDQKLVRKESKKLFKKSKSPMNFRKQKKGTKA